MKKNLLLIFLLLAILLLASCKKEPVSTEVTPTLPITTETSAPAASLTPSLTEGSYFDSVKYSRDGDTLVINVVDGKSKNCEFGVIILTDEKYANSWKENQSAVIDIAQLSTDYSGKGSVELTVPQSVSNFVICISHSGGNYILQVGGNHEN